MTIVPYNSCPWVERVSALLDDELPDVQRELVRSHAQSCSDCAPILGQHDATGEIRPDSDSWSRIMATLPKRNTPQLRALLALIGILIVIGSLPGFIRGNTDGNSLHDLRHLSIWQFAIGVGTISASISFRISRLLTVIITTFLILTIIATVYDLLTGHAGPWTDPMHLIEIAAVLAILRLIYPHLRLSKIQRKSSLGNH